MSQRLIALRTLTRVLSDRIFLDEALDEVPVDFRPWVHEVVAGVLRWRGRLDWIIDQLALKKKPTGAIRKTLQVALYQLLNQPQVQPAWIVSETVDMVREREGSAASGFVNALLRRVTGNLDAWRAMAFPANDAATQSRWASMPEWIWRRLVRDHGLEWARDFAAQGLERPSVWVRSREPVEAAEPGPVPESYRLREWRPIHKTEAFVQGRLFIQDLSSQQLVHEFCNQVGKAGTLLDLCAAPGGKSAGMAWNGWSVVATDRSTDRSDDGKLESGRFEKLRETAGRMSKSNPFRVLRRDEALASGPFDAIWVDAPCTGSGVMRRHPEIRWLKDEKDLKSLMELQQTLVSDAVSHLRPGGFLMYTVCSVLNDELKAASQIAPGYKMEKVREWRISGQGDGFSGVLLRLLARPDQ